MTESKKDEVLDGGSNSEPNPKPNTQEDDTSQNNEGIEGLKEKFAKLEKENSDFKKAYFNEKSKNKDLKLQLENSNKTDETPEIQQESDDEIPAWYLKEQNKSKEDNIKSAFKEFCEENDELHQVNDLDNEKYSKFKNAVEAKSRFINSSDKESIKQDLKFIFNQTIESKPDTNNPTEDSEVGDSGVGDSSRQTKTQDKKPSALTRELNEFEKRAAALYPGGESEYRKSLANIEGSK